MGIILDSISFDNEFQASSTSWLLANIGEKITATIDFTVKKSIQANMRLTIKRLLRKYKYPPEHSPHAIELIMEQAQMFGEEWATS